MPLPWDTQKSWNTLLKCFKSSFLSCRSEKILSIMVDSKGKIVKEERLTWAHFGNHYHSNIQHAVLQTGCGSIEYWVVITNSPNLSTRFLLCTLSFIFIFEFSQFEASFPNATHVSNWRCFLRLLVLLNCSALSCLGHCRCPTCYVFILYDSFRM